MCTYFCNNYSKNYLSFNEKCGRFFLKIIGCFCQIHLNALSFAGLAGVPSSADLLFMASQPGSPWKFPSMPLSMADLSSLMHQSHQNQANLQNLYFGLQRSAFPPFAMNPGFIPGASHLQSPTSTSSIRTQASSTSLSPSTSITSPVTASHSSMYSSVPLTTSRLPSLYPGLKYHPYFHPRLVQPAASKDPECDGLAPQV